MSPKFFLCVLGALGGSLAAAAEPNALAADEVSDGWVLLFDGKTLAGWTAASEANWAVVDGVISVSGGAKGLLCTDAEYGDYELKVDYRAPEGTNSGIFLRTLPKPTDPANDCYELNIAPPSNPFPTGSLVKRQRTEAKAPTPDQWHTLGVTAKGSRLVVYVDGREVLDYTDPDPLPRGHIGLQLNQGPVEFRSIKIRPFRQ